MEFRGKPVFVRDRPAALARVLQLVAVAFRQEFRRYPFPGVNAEARPLDVFVVDGFLAVFVCREVV